MGRVNWSAVIAAVFMMFACVSLMLGRAPLEALVYAVLAIPPAIMAHLK